jgi:hypothetical protein
MTTGLFSIEPPANASHGYINLYSAATDEHRKIREHCEYLWRLYKPYAVSDAGTGIRVHDEPRYSAFIL